MRSAAPFTTSPSPVNRSRDSRVIVPFTPASVSATRVIVTSRSRRRPSSSSTRTTSPSRAPSCRARSPVIINPSAGGGTIAVYRGSTLVGTWSLASSTSRTVLKSFSLKATGQKLTIKVIKAGTTGASIDGWGVTL